MPLTLAINLAPFIVRVGRIELPSTAWKAVILPLNYTRNSSLNTKTQYTQFFAEIKTHEHAAILLKCGRSIAKSYYQRPVMRRVFIVCVF